MEKQSLSGILGANSLAKVDSPNAMKLPIFSRSEHVLQRSLLKVHWTAPEPNRRYFSCELANHLNKNP